MRSLARSPTVRWVLLALAGLAIAIAVGVIASRVTSQRIGLASEPLSAGESLAPHAEDRGHGGGGGDHSQTTTETTTSESTTTTVAPPSSTTTTTPTTTDDSGSGPEDDSSGSDDD